MEAAPAWRRSYSATSSFSSDTSARSPMRGETQNRWFFYGQDTFRVTKKLTINYGLRWEIYRPQSVNGAGKGGYVDLGTGEVLVAGSQGVGLNLNVSGKLTDFAPRLGIAYQLRPKTVIRTGYGRGLRPRDFRLDFWAQRHAELPVLGIQTLAPANNFDTVFTLAQGPTSFDPASALNSQPKGPNGRPLLPNGVTPFIISQNMRLPTVDAWNFTIQHQLTSTISVEAAYVGNKGTHVFAGTGGDYDPNQATLAGYAAGLSANLRKPFYQKFGWSQSLRYFASDASNNYNSLQTKVEKRFSQGLHVMAHYTWSKNFDYSGTYYPVDATYSRGISDNNRKHAFTAVSLWEVPFGKGRKYGSNLSKPTDWLLGGWQLNGTFNWASGLPFTPSYQACNSDRDSGWCRPDVAGTVTVSNPSQFGWFATTSGLLTSNGQVDGAWRRPQKGRSGKRRPQRADWPEVQPTGHVFLQDVSDHREASHAVPRGVIQLRQSHQSWPAKWLRRLPGRRRPHLQCDRQLRPAPMADGGPLRVLILCHQSSGAATRTMAGQQTR